MPPTSRSEQGAGVNVPAASRLGAILLSDRDPNGPKLTRAKIGELCRRLAREFDVGWARRQFSMLRPRVSMVSSVHTLRSASHFESIVYVICLANGSGQVATAVEPHLSVTWATTSPPEISMNRGGESVDDRLRWSKRTFSGSRSSACRAWPVMRQPLNNRAPCRVLLASSRQFQRQVAGLEATEVHGVLLPGAGDDSVQSGGTPETVKGASMHRGATAATSKTSARCRRRRSVAANTTSPSLSPKTSFIRSCACWARWAWRRSRCIVKQWASTSIDTLREMTHEEVERLLGYRPRHLDR